MSQCVEDDFFRRKVTLHENEMYVALLGLCERARWIATFVVRLSFDFSDVTCEYPGYKAKDMGMERLNLGDHYPNLALVASTHFLQGTII